MKDIISINDFSKEHLLDILRLAQKLEKEDISEVMQGKVLASLFFEPSTRTRLSFDSAMKLMGGKVIGFQSDASTSIQKGETLKDTIKMIDHYADIVVIRHPLEGSARWASESTTLPVINAGDGANQHPTQTMLDLFTILKTQNKLDGLKIAMVGDLKYGRTVHSLSLALSHFSSSQHFVAPAQLQMPEEICKHLAKKNIAFTFHSEMEEIIEHADIIYMTRIQKERFPDINEYEKVKNTYILKKKLATLLKPNAKILHPLPRVNEIHHDVDTLPNAHYFNQAKNGIIIRQTLLKMALEKAEKTRKSSD